MYIYLYLSLFILNQPISLLAIIYQLKLFTEIYLIFLCKPSVPNEFFSLYSSRFNIRLSNFGKKSLGSTRVWATNYGYDFSIMFRTSANPV